MNKAKHSGNTEAKAKFTESDPNIESNAKPCENHRQNSIEAEFLTDGRTHSVLSDNLALLVRGFESLGHCKFKASIITANTNLVRVGRRTAERADAGTLDAGLAQSTVQISFVLGVILILDRIDLTTREVDTEIEALHGDASDTCDNQNPGESLELAAVLHEREVGVVQSLEATTDRKRRSVALSKSPVEDSTGNRDSAEERREDTDSKRKTETLDRASTDFVQNKTRQNGGQVGVQDGAESTFVTLRDGGTSSEAVLEFFTDTFENNHVRVERHTDDEDEASDTRQRKRCVEHGHHGGSHEGVDHHADACDEAAQAVVGNHEHQADQEADCTGTEALDNVFFTEGSTDGTAFDNLHRGLEGASLQDDSEAVRFSHVFETGNLGFAVRDTVTDDRSADDLVIKNDGHLLADVCSSHSRELLRTDATKAEVHGHFTGADTVTYAVRASIRNIVTAHFGTAPEEIKTLGLDLGVTTELFKTATESECDVTRNELLDAIRFEELFHLFDAFFSNETAIAERDEERGKRLSDHVCRSGLGLGNSGILLFGSFSLSDATSEKFFIRHGFLLRRIRLGRILLGRVRHNGISSDVGRLASEVAIDQADHLRKLFRFGKNLEFELSGRTHKSLCRRVIHTSQFNDNSVVAGRGNLRFRKTVLVNAVTDDFKGLSLNVLDIVAILEAGLINLQRDAGTTGKVQAKVNGTCPELRIFLEESLLHFPLLGVNLNRRPYGVGRKNDDSKNDEFSQAEFMFIHL